MVVNLLVAASRWERTVILLPALVIGAGLVAGVFILLGRAFADSVRGSRHPRWIVAGVVTLAGTIVLLTWLGVSLPRE
jgi:prepilin signal peptidase PulO-like enzyme (type II secretory pathway)